MELRPHQVRAARALSKAFETVRRVLILACTGAGKTALAGFVCVRAIASGKVVMWVVNREEILDQTWDTLLSFGFRPEDMSVIRGDDKRYRANAKVYIGSIQTLMNRTSLPKVHYLVLDEAHHYLQKNTWSRIPERFPDARIIGLTATPVPGRGTEPAFDQMIHMAQPSELIAQDFLTAPRVYGVPEDQLPELGNVRVVGGEFVNDDLDKAVNTTKLVGNIVQHWLELAYMRRTVVFCTSVDHANNVAEEYKKHGIAAESFHGKLSKHDRKAVMDRLQAGDTTVIATIGICLEGWDAPHVRCGVIARPTKSLIVAIQMYGRVMRYFNGEDSIILDHAGNTDRHGMPDEDREWTLEGPVATAPRVKTCPECYMIVPANTAVCPGCQHDFRAKEEGEKRVREIKELEGKLVEKKRAAERVADARRALWDKLCDQASKNGYKDGWVRMKFDEVYEEPAPLTWPKPARPDTKADDAKRRAELDKLRTAQYSNEMPPGWAAEKYQTRFGEPVAALEAREQALIETARRPTPPAAAAAPAALTPPPVPDIIELDEGPDDGPLSMEY